MDKDRQIDSVEWRSEREKEREGEMKKSELRVGRKKYV